MIRTLTGAAAALSLAVLPLIAAAAVTAGTVLTGTIDQPLSSNHVQVGTPFTMSNVSSQDNNITGARIYGHVTDFQKAGQGTPGKIYLGFDRLVTRSGNTYALNARATNVQETTKTNAVKEVGGAVAGMIVGNMVGKAVGTNLGGLLGAAGGYIIAHNNKEDVNISANSQVTAQVLSARPQARR